MSTLRLSFLPGCDEGRFNVTEAEAVDLCAGEAVVSSPQAIGPISQGGNAHHNSAGQRAVMSGHMDNSIDAIRSGGNHIPQEISSGECTPSTVTVVTPVKVKSEDFGCDSDDCSRFSDGFAPIDYNNTKNIDPKEEETDEGSRFSDIEPSIHNINPKKEETDDEEEASRFSHDNDDEASRFSDVSDLSKLERYDSQAMIKLEMKQGTVEAVIKEEPTLAELTRRQAKHSRQYGDRVLLARQSKLGMMKLGGGNQASFLYPKHPEERLARMDGRYCMAYNSMWNFGAPKYAGQRSGHVTFLPRHDCYDRHDHDEEKSPFSVFAMRSFKHSTLGWEYCGEYMLLDDLKGTTAAYCISVRNKKFILQDINKSLSRLNGYWKDGIQYWRDKIRVTCENDSSRAGPARLIRLANKEPEPDDGGREREERLDRESREKATSAAKARALGLDDEGLSHTEFARRLMDYDDFFGSYAIKFVRYDESMYDFVKDGMTTKNMRNKRRAEDEPCAKASDWYNIMDQQLEENDRREKKQRKRKRT